MSKTDPPNNSLLDTPPDKLPRQTTSKERSYSLRYSGAGLMYLVTIFSWLGGGFPFSEGWLDRLTLNFRVILDSPVEILILFGYGLGASIFPIIGLFLYYSLLKIPKERTHARVGLIIGIALITTNMIGSLGM